MLSQEDVDTLQEGCSTIAHLNWDGRVEVRQHATEGHTEEHLSFELLGDAGEQQALWIAYPEGEFQGSLIYEFHNHLDKDQNPVRMTLVPAAICGLLGL